MDPSLVGSKPLKNKNTSIVQIILHFFPPRHPPYLQLLRRRAAMIPQVLMLLVLLRLRVILLRTKPRVLVLLVLVLLMLLVLLL